MSNLTDNRRAVVRIVANEMIRTASSMARLHGDDVIEYIVFTAIWSLNAQHLIGDSRYAELKRIPPDSVRRPVPVAELRRAVPMPEDILLSYLERLIQRGFVEKVAGGLIVPSAVFTEPAMLRGSNELYDRVVSMIQAMREVGFSFGEAEAADLISN